MQPDEKTVWNKKYAEGSHGRLEPEPLLARAYAEHICGSPPGRALDVAGGAGRHAIWLAQRGWQVKLIDISEAGVALACKNAERVLGSATANPALRGAAVETEVADLRTTLHLGQEEYDLVLVFLYLQRELFPALISALKPGAFLIYQTYITGQRDRGGPGNPQYLLRPNELREAFEFLHILHYQETAQGRAELVAQKPRLPAKC